MSGTTRPTRSARIPSTSTWPGCAPSSPAPECGSRPSAASATGSLPCESQPRMRASPAAKVAAVATAVIAGVYIIGVIVLNLVVARHMTDQNDARLAEHITAAQHDHAAVSQRVIRDGLGPG